MFQCTSTSKSAQHNDLPHSTSKSQPAHTPKFVLAIVLLCANLHTAAKQLRKSVPTCSHGQSTEFLRSDTTRRSICVKSANRQLDIRTLPRTIRGHQTASKPVNVYGPNDPRTHVHPQRLRRRVGKSRRCAIRPAHSPCCQPLGSGTVQHRAAVACRLAFVARRVHGMVGCSSRYACVKFRLVPMSTRRAADATPHSTPTEEQRSTMGERNNEQRTLTTL